MVYVFLCSTLKSIEFSGSTLTTESDSDKPEDKKGKSLEMLLLEKNRGLQNENTQLKTQQAELTGKYKIYRHFQN